MSTDAEPGGRGVHGGGSRRGQPSLRAPARRASGGPGGGPVAPGDDTPTRLPRRTPSRPGPLFPGWLIELFPDAGEAGGCFVPMLRRHDTGVRGAAGDPERSRAEAGRRARARLRRYGAANRLNRMGTLTYGPPRCTDAVELRGHVAQFFRELRADLGGKPFPYIWVPELHADRVHWHVHFAVGQHIARSTIRRAWGRGLIHMPQINDLPVGSTTRDEARAAARYLAKYVTKDFPTHVTGLHRYEVAQGFQPVHETLRGPTADAVIEKASLRMGGPPSRYWNSEQAENWRAAPAIWVSWS